jgi:hypothetical protein
MMKALTWGALCLASFAITVDPVAVSTTEKEVAWRDSSNLSKEEKQFDEFFRDSIGALGDSELKRVREEGSWTEMEYLDTTNEDDIVVAWQVSGSRNDDEQRVEKVVQVKTIPHTDDENISEIVKTTYQRTKLSELAKA